MRLIAIFLFLLLPPSHAGQVFSSLEALENKNTTLINNAAGADEKIIKTVTASGYGTSVDAAAQNAAENALIQVVGSFIDAETQIKKQKEIRDGVISKTKVIQKDIKDYSQGSIKSFEILNIQQNDSIYNITARVDVRVEDFRAYIKELAYGSTIVGSNLFTQIATEKENKDSKRDILIKKVLNPIMQGEVVEIKIGAPQSLDAFYSSKYCMNINSKNSRYNPNSLCKENGYFSGLNKLETVIMPVRFKLKENFLENLKNTLENISDDKIETYNIRTPEDLFYFKRPEGWKNNARKYELALKTKNNTSIFFLTDIISQDWSIYHPMRGMKSYTDAYFFGNTSVGKFFNNIRIKVLDHQGNVLMAKDFGLLNQSSFPFVFYETYGSWGDPRYSLYSSDSFYQFQTIHSQREYWLAIEMDIDVLKNTNSISIEYIQ